MDELEKLRRQLQNGAMGDKMRKAASSPEGQRLLRSVDTSAVESAAKRGDVDALKKIVAGVLSTSEGQALAKMIKQSMEGK